MRAIPVTTSSTSRSSDILLGRFVALRLEDVLFLELRVLLLLVVVRLARLEVFLLAAMVKHHSFYGA